MNPEATNAEGDDDELPVDPAITHAAVEAYERLMDGIRSNRGDLTEQNKKDVKALRKFEEALPPEEPSEKEKQIEATILELHNADERECVDDLRKLLSELPAHFSSFSHFVGLPLLSDAKREYWEDFEDVRYMGEDARALTRVGIRPVNLIEIPHYIQLLADRQNQGEHFISPHVLPDGSIHLNPDLLRGEIGMVLEGRKPKIEAAYVWLLDVLRCKPELLEGFHATVTEDGIIVRPLRDPAA